MANIRIEQSLRGQNRHWQEKFTPEFQPREIYPEIRSAMKEKRMLVITGLRRTGKSQIVKKLIADTVEKGADPQKIVLFSFDDFSPADATVFDIIESAIALTGLEPEFLFFDEVQKLGNWAEKIKLAYDTGKYKIVVTGSNSLWLGKKSRESLAGRTIEFKVSLLTFSEFLEFTGNQKYGEKSRLFFPKLENEIDKYFLTGGFPEVAGNADGAAVGSYIKSVIEKITHIDAPKAYDIDNPALLSDLYFLVAESPGMLVDYSSIAQEKGATRQTVSRYFDCLEAAFLVRKVCNFSRNRSSMQKRLKKYYPAITSTSLSIATQENTKSRLVECAVGNKINAEYFFRDQYKNEVDFVIQDAKGKTIPVEVKYGKNPSKAKRGLDAFESKFKFESATIVTKDKRGTDKTKKGTEISYKTAVEMLLGK